VHLQGDEGYRDVRIIQSYPSKVGVSCDWMRVSVSVFKLAWNLGELFFGHLCLYTFSLEKYSIQWVAHAFLIKENGLFMHACHLYSFEHAKTTIHAPLLGMVCIPVLISEKWSQKKPVTKQWYRPFESDHSEKKFDHSGRSESPDPHGAPTYEAFWTLDGSSFSFLIF
jgi:hypothetical protein